MLGLGTSTDFAFFLLDIKACPLPAVPYFTVRVVNTENMEKVDDGNKQPFKNFFSQTVSRFGLSFLKHGMLSLSNALF